MLQNPSPTTHQCLCYERSGKPALRLESYERGAAGTAQLGSHHILFILRGKARYTLAETGHRAVEVDGGHFIFLPISTSLRWEALEETAVLAVRLDRLVGKLTECNAFRFQRTASSAVPLQEGAYALPVNARIAHFLTGVQQTLTDGLQCRNYDDHLVGQLLTLIQVYYPQSEYMRFYATVATSDVVFADTVYEKWRSCRTVGELSNAFDMDIQRFAMHFQRVFGCTPGVWLKRRRMEYVYHDICSSHKSLRQIAADHDFSVTNFIRYCRMNFDKTPGAIRQELIAAHEAQ